MFNQNNPIGATAVSMYLYLLKTGYETDSYDFKISDIMVGNELKITRKTVKIVKLKLKDSGLIDFSTKNGTACIYKLLLNYPTEAIQYKQNKVMSIEDGECIIDDHRLRYKEIPTLSEFLTYVRTLKPYQSQIETKVIIKYNHWLQNNWCSDNTNRPINNWKATIKSILPYLKDMDGTNEMVLSDIPKINRP
ncbi:hypothetical protein ACFOWU_09430 [Epilithonimonas zeae]